MGNRRHKTTAGATGSRIEFLLGGFQQRCVTAWAGALVLNYRGLALIDGRFASIERRLDMMQSDMKDLKKALTALKIDVALS